MCKNGGFRSVGHISQIFQISWTTWCTLNTDWEGYYCGILTIYNFCLRKPNATVLQQWFVALTFYIYQETASILKLLPRLWFSVIVGVLFEVIDIYIYIYIYIAFRFLNVPSIWCWCPSNIAILSTGWKCCYTFGPEMCASHLEEV